MINKIILILIFLVLIYIYIGYILSYRETFSLGYGRSFSYFHHPIPKCTLDNNCYAGSYYNKHIYQNMCQPKQGLLKQKRDLIDTKITYIK